LEAAGSPRLIGRFYKGLERLRAAFRPIANWKRTLLAGLAAASFLAPACTTVPVTGRKQLNPLGIETDMQLGAQGYAEALQGAPTVSSGSQYTMVKRVFDRIVAVADDPGFEWEVKLVEDSNMVNAWAMPGGKMAVYTGILPVTQTETGLAVVMGHEIGHAVARHGTERISQQVGISALLDFLAGQGTSAQWSPYLSLGVFLPWGRKQELEADLIGLMYMARAGYDPREASLFWQRMSQLSGGNEPPKFLSTHPSDETRIAQIEDNMKKALKVWNKSRQGGPQP
jgi:predicted Zn-dependent protease